MVSYGILLAVLGILLVFPQIMRLFDNTLIHIVLYFVFSGILVYLMGTDATILAPLMLITTYFAVMAVIESRVMRAAIFLLLAMVTLGFSYIFLNSEILTALHISVYGGGIAILVLFAAVLIEENSSIVDERTQINGYIITFALAMIMISLVFRGVPKSNAATAIINLDDGFALIRDYSYFLWTTYTHVIPFLALLILGALIGAVRLALTDKEVIHEEKEVAI